MPETFINVIKNQALSSKNEIYGWLIGYQKDNIPRVLAIVECKRFEERSFISAIPDAQEFQEISSIMPQGIGPIGIYHSHPFSSKIFHSHTDDTTLLSLSNQFPNCVSIVTNGEDINYYQMGKNSKTNEINVEFVESEIPKFLLISIDEKILIKINKNIMNNTKDNSSLKIRILNSLRVYFENIWNDLELFYKNSKISETDAITKYLVNDLTTDIISLKIPAKNKNKEKNQIIIDNNDNLENKLIDKTYTCLELNLKAIVLVYITKENKYFQELNQAIKTELISNNILQKIYNCILDYDNKKIINPDDFYLKFFGFFIRVLYFKKRFLNNNEISRRIFEFVLKTISLFDSFRNMELSDKIKSQIQTFLYDITKISKNFNWQNEVKNNIEDLKEKIKL